MCLNNILYVCMFVLEYLKCFSGLIVTLLSLSCMVKVGGELTDFIIVLRTAKAVKAFGGRAHLSLGAGMSAAAGPVGRAAEADLRAGDGGAAACYTYSCSKGESSFYGNCVSRSFGLFFLLICNSQVRIAHFVVVLNRGFCWGLIGVQCGGNTH
jgi:hypothetical protein